MLRCSPGFPGWEHKCREHRRCAGGQGAGTRGAVRPVGLCRVLRHVTGSQALSAFRAQQLPWLILIMLTFERLAELLCSRTYDGKNITN